MSSGFETWLEGCRQRIDAHLEELLPAPDEPPEALHRAMRYAVLGPGKRVRPALAFGAAQALGRSAEEVLGVAAAVELVHAYSLVHDDLPAIDDSAERRGRPSVHAQFGEADALLAGDALLPLAFETLAEAGTPSAVVRRLAQTAGSRGLVGGQVDDLAWCSREPDRAALGAIHERKTAALFRFASWGAAQVCQAAPPELEALDRFALHFGLAFQALDDLSDDRPDECSILSVMSRSQARAAIAAEQSSAIAALARFGAKAAGLRGLAEKVGRPLP